MPWYIHRVGTRTDILAGDNIPVEGWTGPINSYDQATREAAAWQSIGHAATIHPDTPDIQAAATQWQDTTIDGWRDSTCRSQRDRWYAREETRRTETDQ